MASGLVAVGLFTAGCSHHASNLGVAAVKTASATGTKADPLTFSACMRSHGVSDFPDPDGHGNIAINLDPNNPTFKAAEATCKSLSPEHQVSPAQRPQLAAALLKFSQCMRAHGVADFPDPAAAGGLQVSDSPGSDLDPKNPQNKAATAACKQFQPKPPDGGAGPTLASGQGPGGS